MVTFAQIAEITLDAICRDPEMLGAAFLASSEPDEYGHDSTDESTRSLLDACKKRDIDPAPAIRAAIQRRHELMELFTNKQVKVNHSPRSFRVPMEFRGLNRS